MYNNNTILLLLITSLSSYNSYAQPWYYPLPAKQKTAQTKAKLNNLKADSIESTQVRTNNLQCQEAQVSWLSAQNAKIQKLAVEELEIINKPTNTHRYVKHIFQMRDFFRVGSSGFKAVRTIKNTYDHPLYPKNEIRGWKMTEPTDKGKDNDPVYVTEHVPSHITSNNQEIILEAHFVIPQSDAPEDGSEQFVRLGVWIDSLPDQLHPNKPEPCFFESEETRVPTKSEFGPSKVIDLVVRTTVPSSAVDSGFTYILLKRITVTENKKEFDHRQGIALNMLTVQYPA